MAEAETVPAVFDRPRGWRRYVYATNHKDVGTLCLWFALLAGIAGAVLASEMRTEISQPGLQAFKSVHAYGVTVTAHGLMMVFFTVLPAIAGFANWIVPLQIGAPDTAFPRLNAVAFWLLPFAFVLLLLSMTVEGEGGMPGTAAGWTLIAPLSTTGSPGPAVDFVIVALYLAIVSAVLTAVNLATTILNMRSVGMTLAKMPVFVWSALIAALFLVFALPVLAGAVTMLLADRHFGTSFFNPAGGGDPLLYQNLFWFFALPGLFALILPGFGMVAQVVSAFAKKPPFAVRSMVAAMVWLGLLGALSMADHLYTAGLQPGLRLPVQIAALAAAVPAAVLIGALLATLWGGAISFKSPMLFGFGFIVMFTLGSLSGVLSAVPGLAPLTHGTAFAVAHLHYVFGMAAVFASFAGFYFWFPKMSGRRYSEAFAKIHFWLTFIGVNLAFFPQYIAGLAGAGRRVADVPDAYSGLQHISSAGAAIAGIGILIFIIGVVEAFAKRRKAGDNPWGVEATTLEWTLSSPPPYRTFNVLPKIT